MFRNGSRFNAPGGGFTEDEVDFNKMEIDNMWSAIVTMATVPAQAAEVCELGAVQGATTRNLGAPIQAKDTPPRRRVGGHDEARC